MNYLTETRNLLQRAMWRGQKDIVKLAVGYLHYLGDTAWLATKYVPQIMEVCWMGGKVCGLKHDLQIQLKISEVMKTRDAIGLGFLAYQFLKGDTSVLSVSEKPDNIKLISAALQKPIKFIDWAAKSARTGEAKSVVENVTVAMDGRGDWDKAILFSGTLLAVQSKMPFFGAKSHKMVELPMWCVFDKSTASGKIALQNFANEHNITFEQACLVFYYTQIALINEPEKEIWWKLKVRYNLGKNNLSVDDVNKYGKLMLDFDNTLADESKKFYDTMTHGASIFLAGSSTMNSVK